MSTLNKTALSLVNDLVEAGKFSQKTTKETVKTTKTASNLASLYEKARNAVEFRDEHLVRQAAIERILKRRLFLNQESDKIGALLIKELSWAKYYSSNSIESSKIKVLSETISKYRDAIKNLDSNYTDKLIGLCSCEIEEILTFNPISQILINFVSSSIFPRIDFGEEDKTIKSIQVYIAVERTFAKNSEILITYKLLKVLLPKWQDPNKLNQTLKEIDSYLNYPLKNILKIKISQIIPPFNLIREIIKSTPDFENVIKNAEELKKVSIKILEEKYTETKDKVLRASKRSIIYIFLTKMILAVLIEIPFEIIFKEVNYAVLAVNMLFPPSLMFLFNLGIKLPDRKNTELMIEKLNEYFYFEEEKIIPDFIDSEKKPARFERAFYYLFITTSLLVTIGLLWFLNILGFSFISQVIFLFFLSVVSFFAFRVREISKDYQLKDNYNESFFETLLDYLFLPIIKTGQFLSNEISKLNILSFIFDFIIEAPLKTFLEILENWLHFVRIKKEEILS